MFQFVQQNSHWQLGCFRGQTAVFQFHVANATHIVWKTRISKWKFIYLFHHQYDKIEKIMIVLFSHLQMEKVVAF